MEGITVEMSGNSYLNTRLDAAIKISLDSIAELAVKLCKIPSMTGNEKNKAGFIKDLLCEMFGPGAWIDEAGNVLFLHRCADNERIGVYSAHIDTVFSDIHKIIPEIRGNRIFAPSIWDNSINIAGLIYSIKILRDLDIPLNKNILFAFDVGEEGYGNLKGIRNIVEKRRHLIDELVAVDLGYDSIIDTAVGSRRYSVTVQTPGGHSWSDFGVPNAISSAAGIIAELYNIKMPDNYRYTYNVGVIKGGTSINTIAPLCEFDVDLRSENAKSLTELDLKFKEVLERTKKTDIDVSCRLMGERPSGKLSLHCRISDRINTVRNNLGLEIKFRDGSTDANLPLSIGIPAVSFGVCNGGGAHTAEEYIEINTLETGMKHLMYFMLEGI